MIRARSSFAVTSSRAVGVALSSFSLLLAPACYDSDDVGWATSKGDGGGGDGGDAAPDKCKAGGDVYPTTGCGTNVDNLLANYTFTGRLQGRNSPSATTIKMSDFYDPDGTKGNRYLFINVSALWCAYCKEEAKQLSGLKAKFGSKGVLFMTDLAQKLDSSPADQGDVDAWISTYALDTTVVNDPSFQLGAAFFDPAKMPLNLLIDLKTMKILVKSTGENLPAITSKLEALTAG